MGAALLLGLMAAIMIPWLGDDDAVDEEPISTEPEEAPIVPLPEDTPAVPDDQPSVPVLQVEGTEAGDNITLADFPTTDSSPAEGVVVNGNEGDDMISLSPEEISSTGEYYPNEIYGATISGGAGDDVIEARVWDSEISGGDGDDTINVSGVLGNRISGGAGDDQIFVNASGDGDSTFVDGDSGNDTIDARGLNNGGVNGGDGDDTILLQGSNYGGTGYGLFADGGAGNDTLIYEISPVTPSEQYETSPFSVRGGEGADTYRFIFNEGYLETRDIPEDADLITMPTLYVIEDFEPGLDTLDLQPSVDGSAYELSGLRLEEDEQAGTTDVIVSYTSETEINRDVVITINATGVDIDDLVLPDGLAMEEVA